MPLQTTKQPCCYPVNLQGWEDRWRQMVYCWATFAQAEVNEMSKLGSFLDYTSCCLFLTASVTTAVWIMINITILLSKLLEFVFHKGLCSTSGKKIFCMSFPQWFKNFFFFFCFSFAKYILHFWSVCLQQTGILYTTLTCAYCWHRISWENIVFLKEQHQF